MMAAARAFVVWSGCVVSGLFLANIVLGSEQGTSRVFGQFLCRFWGHCKGYHIAECLARCERKSRLVQGSAIDVL